MLTQTFFTPLQVDIEDCGDENIASQHCTPVINSYIPELDQEPVEELTDNNLAQVNTENSHSTQKQKKSSRWHKADPSNWKSIKAKKLRNLGEGYSTKKGEKLAKAPKEIDCSRCRFKCTQFNEEDRAAICSTYWKLEDYCRKKDFILNNVKSHVVQRRRTRKGDGKGRKNAKELFFTKNSEPIRVCQNFFLKTLCISNGPLNTAFKKMNEIGIFNSDDQRGTHIPSNKLPIDDVQEIKDHIESFPVTESHYTRKSSNKMYLDSKLSISKMYSLYKERCDQKKQKPASITTYKRIFGKEYNYSFFKPKKDQCALCMRYKNSTEEDRVALEDT